MVVTLTEIVPVHVRTTGFSVAYSLATAIFGGFTPAVSTFLIHVTQNRAVPALWLMFAAGCGILATLLAFRPAAAAGRAEQAMKPVETAG
jgi:MHS family citrate/tricarballylate:H+ symporter-like MFS transporter